MQGCQSGGQGVVCASTLRKMDKTATGAGVHPGTWGYADRWMVVLDGWSADVEVGVGSDEEHSLMDSPVSSAVVQGGRCVVQCSIWNCHGTPHLHAPDHLQSSPTPSAYTPVSLRCTLRKLAQPCHSCGQTKLRSMSNFPGLSPYVLGCHLSVFFSICHICLMHFH